MCCILYLIILQALPRFWHVLLGWWSFFLKVNTAERDFMMLKTTASEVRTCYCWMIPTSPVVWPSGVSIVWSQHKVVVWCLGLEASRESDDDDDDDDGDDGDDGTYDFYWLCHEILRILGLGSVAFAETPFSPQHWPCVLFSKLIWRPLVLSLKPLCWYRGAAEEWSCVGVQQ